MLVIGWVDERSGVVSVRCADSVLGCRDIAKREKLSYKTGLDSDAGREGWTEPIGVDGTLGLLCR